MLEIDESGQITYSGVNYTPEYITATAVFVLHDYLLEHEHTIL